MSLLLIETPFLSVTALTVDAALEAGRVHLLGMEPIGTEVILSRFQGLPGDVRAALDAAVDRARGLGSGVAASTVLDMPADGLESVLSGNPTINPLYGGREFLLPAEPSPTEPAMQPPAIGILETQGLTAILHATDAMLKSADVTLVGKEKIGAAYVAIIIQGDVGSVQTALEAGAAAVGGLGKLIASQIITRPHGDLLKLLPTV